MSPEAIMQRMKDFNLEPRDYQSRVISQVVNSFNDGIKSILIESPTGSGKTLMGLTALKLIEEASPGTKFGWVAMRRKLLSQAFKENLRVGVNNIEFISMFDKDPPKCDIMITDEAQHDAAATCSTLHKTMGAKKSLGLTATPFRTDRIKLAYEKIIRDCGVRFLVEQNYLSQFRQHAIDEFTPQSVASAYLANPKRWGKSVVYMLNNDLCFETCRLLQEGGVSAAVMLGNQPMSVRDKMFEDFESGAIQVLINIYLLTEGFDAPDLMTAWVRDSCKLPTMQMSGRVLRKDPNNPNKVANIVQSSRTRYPYTKTAKASAEFVYTNGKWLQLGEGPMVAQIVEKVQQRLWTKATNLPIYLSGSSPSISIRAMAKGGGIKIKQRQKDKKSGINGLFNGDDE